MTVVNSKEFVSNEKRYFDLAVDEELFIKRGKNVFHLVCTTTSDGINDADDGDNDEYITKDELIAGIYEDIDKFYEQDSFIFNDFYFEHRLCCCFEG